MAEKGPIDYSNLPDFDKNFVNEDDIEAFDKAINAPDTAEEEFITALNDWRPVNQKIRKKKGKVRREKDETREGIVYTILKWPLLILIGAWILILSIVYLLTRFYISQYEYWITWRGKREKLRRRLRSARNYPEWIASAQALDQYLGADAWKESDAFAYYDYVTIRRVLGDMKRLRIKAQEEIQAESQTSKDSNGYLQAPSANSGKFTNFEELRILLEGCVKSNFGGIESSRLYSQTYHGTKNLLQDYVSEVERSLKLILESNLLPVEEKRIFFKHLRSNFGQSALCLSGGATFAYYHFGVIKALLDAKLLPKVVTGTSGGALVAALLCTRTDDELKLLLVPELAEKITACHDNTLTWLARWWKTGARFDSVDWARRCSWFTRGSMTFKEAYKRTGRILNISCIPSDPHSPSLLLNHITAPDCVIWSATIASAAVPGILNPVVLMRKTKSGALVPFSFGHKWKDGSLRTDIPLRALNRHFNVNFSIVSQVNPHINIFFFSSRGTVGRPVTHRKGKGWRGGFLGSAVEQYLKLDLAKWLKVLRHLELLPRPMSQDWSSLWLQKFDGNITIWPKTLITDFFYILSDPTHDRLARMLQVGQTETFPKLLFISNRLRIERLIEAGRRQTRGIHTVQSEGENLQQPPQLRYRGRTRPSISPGARGTRSDPQVENNTIGSGNGSPNTARKFSWLGWSLGGSTGHEGAEYPLGADPSSLDDGRINGSRRNSRGNRLEEISRQGSVIFGFQDSDGSTDLSEFEAEERERTEEYQGIGSTASEEEVEEGDGGDEGSENGEDTHLEQDSQDGQTPEFVEGGGRALL